MPSLKDIRTKIASVKSTKRIMQAMKMIATVKYAKTQVMLNSFRSYFMSYKEIISFVSKSTKDSPSRFFNDLEGNKKSLLVIISSDRGLCGSYNSNLFRLIDRYEFSEKIIEKFFIGKKGQDYFKENSFGDQTFSLDEKNYKILSENISNKILPYFLNGEFDQIYVAYNKFVSSISQLPTITKVLPIELEDHEDAKKDLNILIEPDINSFIEIVVPKFFELTISSLLLEAITSEHAARTAAMDNATRNADDIIKETTMLFNKTRQADITKELMDIVNGSEAMK
jgi:F-type H+-transporting ATPase subunit gamma